MMKKVSLLAVLVCVLMGVGACKQPVDSGAPAEGVTSVGKEETKNTPVPSEEIEIKNIEYGSEEIFLEGKKLDRLTVTGTDDMYYCNLEENMKIEYGYDKIPVLVCKDPVYDITYYVNYGRDYYIYAYREEKAELAVAIPASDLFCKEGELYFIAETYGRYTFSGFAGGNILKYNPKDGTVTVVADCDAKQMIVYSDGICYEQAGETIPFEEKRVFFSFATGESSFFLMGITNLRRWKGDWLWLDHRLVEFTGTVPESQQTNGHGKYIAAGVEKIHLTDVQGNIKGTLQNVDIPNEHWIGGDFVYYIKDRKEEGETEDRSVLRRYGLKTGIHEDVAVLAYPTELTFTDMIMYNGVVYFGNGLRVEVDSGAQCYMQNTEGTSPKIEYFYTDGDNLFCMKNGKLWLFVEKQETPLIEREFVAGVPLEIGTYVYRLCEP